jgi:thiamine-phosphate pyrophosphorylase
MTDPRLGKGLLPAIQRLPMHSGVVFRHYDIEPQARRKLFQDVRQICRRRGHILLLADTEQRARRWGADGFHARCSGHMFHSAPVHSPREIAEAKRHGAALLFLSPLYATRSHSGARPLGALRFMQLARLAQPATVIALGGMTRAKAQMLDSRVVSGWAAIDAFLD